MQIQTQYILQYGDFGTIPHSMQGRMDTCSPGGECDNVVKSGLEAAMVFPSDHPVTVWTEDTAINYAVSTVVSAIFWYVLVCIR